MSQFSIFMDKENVFQYVSVIHIFQSGPKIYRERAKKKRCVACIGTESEMDKGIFPHPNDKLFRNELNTTAQMYKLYKHKWISYIRIARLYLPCKTPIISNGYEKSFAQYIYPKVYNETGSNVQGVYIMFVCLVWFRLVKVRGFLGVLLLLVCYVRI